MNEAHRPGSPRIWNPKAEKPLYFYSESLDMNFPVSRLEWSDWYRALRVASPDRGDVDMLSALLRDASLETRFPEDPWFDMPWYERENYLADAVITAGWDPPGRQPTQHIPDMQPVPEEFQSKAEPTDVANQTDRDEWGIWYARLSTRNPQLDDFHLLGELILAASFAAQKAGVSESEQPRDLAQAIISAGWTPPAAESHQAVADKAAR